ncbi:plantazolicin family RiPP [Bacillus velezensis]|nr:plantazolicin family RiPP [Bacillus velezensis]TRW30393.1 plantazolicin family RiPP [Bacillus sp. PW192]AWM82238.1 plantazolicin family RiPP [Bacillus velezensis]AXT11544.1 plantazolicin family RiPP [Bacillus velezensis]MBR8695011.1 hypothetical protein [Bacillus velezensis]
MNSLSINFMEEVTIMTQIKVPTALIASVHGEGQHLFEPMAARCTCTTIISSSSTF